MSNLLTPTCAFPTPCHNAAMLSPPPKPRHYLLTKTLFIVGLSLFVWLGVDWLTAIQPTYVLTFPNHGSFGPEIRSDLWQFHAKPADSDEKYLLIQRRCFPTKQHLTTEVHDLHTGKLIVSHHELLSDRLKSIVDYEPWELANADGDIYLIGMGRSDSKTTCNAICQWNILTNQGRVILQDREGSWLTLSDDGSTALIESSLSPLLPSVMGYPGWANTFSLMMLADDGNRMNKLGPVLCRTFSVPELKLRSSFVLPSPCGLMMQHISHDGRYLLLGQPCIPPDFSFSEGAFSLDAKPLQPSGLQVYDLATGQLKQHIADHPGETAYFNYTDRRSNLTEVLLEKDPYQKKKVSSVDQDDDPEIEFLGKRLREHQLAYYHLPGNRWADLDGDRVISCVNSQSKERVLTKDSSTGNWRVWDIDNDGTSRLFRTLTSTLTDAARLIQGSNQLAFIRESYVRWPKWLRPIGEKFPSIRDQIQRSSFHLVFYEYSTDTELGKYRVPAEEGIHSTTTSISSRGNYLVLATTNKEEHTVAVFSLPVKAWSPWWARSAGLLTGLVAFILLIRRTRGNADATI